MNEPGLGRTTTRFRDRRLTRRAALRGVATGALVTALTGAAPGRHWAAAQGSDATPAATPGSPLPLSDSMLQAFEADIKAALQTFKVPGASIALVHGTEIVYNQGFGVRDLGSGAPVTPRTRFRHGSLTKAVTTVMLATLADEGALGWDDRAVDIWPEFRAPTDELTRGLRLRDLLGMGSGLAESATVDLSVVEFFMMAGGLSAVDVLRSVAGLPVVAPPGQAFSYNNTLVAAAAFLGLLKRGTPPEGLAAAYEAEVRERVFGPIGMAEAAIADDPRPLGDDYAVGYARDVFGGPSPLPFVPLGGIAPAGSGLTSGTDMARFLIAQITGGVAPDGARVASAANLAETHRPGVDAGAIAPPPELRPDSASLRYAMGWFVEAFRDGRRLVWHAGGIDGFDSLMGFFPAERLGFSVLTNSDDGALFYLSVQASLLGRLFGLNRGVPALLAGFAPMLQAQTAELAARTRPVDPAAVTPFLGFYEDGFRVRLDDTGGLRLDHGVRSLPVLALADGGYLVADGPSAIVGHPVAFAVGGDGVPVMTIRGFPPVRWQTGG